MKITVLSSTEPDILNALISKGLEAGWTLYGELKFCPGTPQPFVQYMVLYEKASNVKSVDTPLQAARKSQSSADDMVMLRLALATRAGAAHTAHPAIMKFTITDKPGVHVLIYGTLQSPQLNNLEANIETQVDGSHTARTDLGLFIPFLTLDLMQVRVPQEILEEHLEKKAEAERQAARTGTAVGEPESQALTLSGAGRGSQRNKGFRGTKSPPLRPSSGASFTNDDDFENDDCDI